LPATVAAFRRNGRLVLATGTMVEIADFAINAKLGTDALL